MKKPAKKPADAKKYPVPQEQWTLPVSFGTDGVPIDLEDYIKSDTTALSFAQLSQDQKATLTARRIELQPKFEIAMVGAGIVGKEQAIAEVKALTPVGRNLIEIEQRVINLMIEQAKKA